MNLTKATIKRINRHSNIHKPNYIYEIYLIGAILNRAAVILGNSGDYKLNDGSFIEPGIVNPGEHEFISSNTNGEYEVKTICGLAIRYPNWISGTFTHGLNGVDIYEPNKLVKAIIDRYN